MIKKIKITVTDINNLLENLIIQDIFSLKKLNSKYIARYLTSWLENYEVSHNQHKKLKLCIQMEVYTDKILKEWLESGIENKKPCFKIFKQLLKAVKHIHSKGIFHGNLKTKNIYLDRTRNIKITNFSIGKQRKNDAKRNLKDLFGLVVILIELFVNFKNKDHRKTILRQLKDEKKIPNELKDDESIYSLASFMLKNLEKNELIDQALMYPLIKNAI